MSSLESSLISKKIVHFSFLRDVGVLQGELKGKKKSDK